MLHGAFRSWTNGNRQFSTYFKESHLCWTLSGAWFWHICYVHLCKLRWPRRRTHVPRNIALIHSKILMRVSNLTEFDLLLAWFIQRRHIYDVYNAISWRLFYDFYDSYLGCFMTFILGIWLFYDVYKYDYDAYFIVKFQLTSLFLQ